MIYKPRLVRAEWGSIEAMSGADDEETAGGAQIFFEDWTPNTCEIHIHFGGESDEQWESGALVQHCMGFGVVSI